ncbi:hypothetical protein ANCCAN_18882 [Ancylostoma caninum]|uniref:SLC12A transporter C-terminal domain-containing protein n=1 Tax=Ancylostoma caninum TaxID=29170 RepID=A0A368FSU9_ANCCA|nr:hypothetical protein ANCCAN_18882 [Ancylostoma caninum]
MNVGYVLCVHIFSLVVLCPAIAERLNEALRKMVTVNVRIYTVLVDDLNLSMDELERMTYMLAGMVTNRCRIIVIVPSYTVLVDDLNLSMDKLEGRRICSRVIVNGVGKDDVNDREYLGFM